MKHCSPNADPQATMPSLTTVAPRHAAVRLAASVSVQKTTVFSRLQSWRSMMTLAAAMADSSSPWTYASS
uniref:Uncharacterized protein LOC105397933 n=1 Tax=Ulva partita TaxID=1605170 RepID=A0A1C9ZWD7_9CHLO|nr:uncharacterized protein LOC105397933 [Ulva partita]